MENREQPVSSPSLWRRVWSPPEPEISEAGFSGELLIAGIRLLLVLILVYIPASEYIRFVSDGGAREPRLLLATAAVGLLGSLMIYAATRRHQGRSWIGFASSLLDVSLVSATLAMFVFLGRPQEATGNLVIFPVYFLAIGATSLRYDPRICLVTGVLGLLQYAGIVLWAWSIGGDEAFRWSDQAWQGVQILGATALAATVVVRSREIRLLSTRDRFTGLLNRAVFNEQLDREVAFARREGA
ncbi:MAG TPA: hypothetical protein VJ885_14670, partial [Thermoanaerobaculia bacterium]|nr:hypothetical protein [Thermoanaerobaculia bacterium]